MSRAALTRNVAQISADISKDLDRLADRAYELQKHAQALEEAHGKQVADKAVQADGVAAAPGYRLDRTTRLQPFAFLPFNRKLNWKKIRSLNIDKLVRDNDSRTVMELFNDVAQADLEGESGYNLTEANLIKLLRVCQMMMQYVQHTSEQHFHVQQMLEEDNSLMLANMRRMPAMDLASIEAGMQKLGKDYAGLADADLDAMFQQVRVEERTGARDVLGHIVDQAKQELDARSARLQELYDQKQAALQQQAAGSQQQQLQRAPSGGLQQQQQQQQQQLLQRAPSSGSQQQQQQRG
eukprot:CAMPEP_0202924852 /NCGR_PEP_ID=MMETSP1392-20130828/79191_1 /ASSEMBLY_ACC=CAM_ASM_000868 /TAXON_ID=225041 /ORGANISM="Chlamydomonas chlamydogama, Strain SAG 11-48b" /LENGTH=294 /DNA_ID=CAMNT_0049618607 /DNA_START=88 /DNA_END=972 /DNA_ORIENTATION=+